MSKTGIKLPNFFSELKITPSLETLELTRIKALEIAEAPYGSLGNLPANIHQMAYLVAEHAAKCSDALQANDINAVFEHSFRLGMFCESIAKYIAAADSLRERAKATKPRSKGGSATALARQTEAAGTQQKIITLWNRLSHQPERNRAAVIAEKLGISPATVRTHLKKAKTR